MKNFHSITISQLKTESVHTEDQHTQSVAGTYTIMFLPVLSDRIRFSCWDTTPFSHHLQKDFLPEAEEQCFKWWHLCFPWSWVQCCTSGTREVEDYDPKCQFLAPNMEVKFWLKPNYSLFPIYKLIRNCIEKPLIGNYKLSSKLSSCKEEE